MSFAVLDAGENKITFEVSDDKVLTWQDARRDGAARWFAHEVFQGKPVQEFIGPGSSHITMTVRLDIERGVIPRDELRKMRKLRDMGAVMQFTVGGELVGDYVIKSVSETWRRFHRSGVLTTADVSLELEEYA